jgi:hypothetical protein
MGLGRRHTLWSKDDDLQLIGMVSEGSPPVGNAAWEPIAQNFPGRSALACRQRWRFLRDEAAGKAPRDRSRERVANYRRVQKQNREEARTPVVAPYQPPQPVPLSYAVFANHIVFGDPLPGRSALDQRRQSNSTSGGTHATHY